MIAETSGAPSGRGVFAILLLTVLTYLPTVGNGFAMDDTPIASSRSNKFAGADLVITAEHDAGVVDYLGKFFTHHYWYPESYNDGLYRPIAVLSYGLTYQAIGRYLGEDLEAVPQHACNVLLHTWAVWLVIRLLTAVGASGFAALLVGLLFGLHALHSEVVAGIVGRAEIFSFCFGAQAVLLMIRGGVWRNVLAGTLLFLAYGSKESALCWIPFYFCIRLARHWQMALHGQGDVDANRWSPLLGRQAVVALLVLLLPCGLYLWLRYLALYCGDEQIVDMVADFSSNPLVYETLTVRVMTAIKVWGYGLLLCLAPFRLSSLYGPNVFDMVESPLDPWFLLAVLCLGAFCTFGLLRARRQPLLFLAMTCFLGFSSVTSNVPMLIGTILGERLYYVPSLGICILPAVLLPLFRGRGAKIFLSLIALWCAGNMVECVHRGRIWRDSTAVFTHDSAGLPECIDLHRKSAQCLMSGTAAERDKAIWHVRQAIELLPSYSHGHRLLGDILSRKEDYRAAIASYKQAFGRGYREPNGAESLAYNKIGKCLIALSKSAENPAAQRELLREAVDWFKKTLTLVHWGGSHGEANNGIGQVELEFSRIETNRDGRRQRLKSALGRWQKTIDAEDTRPGQLIKALKSVFAHVSDDGAVLVSREKLQRYYARAREVGGGQHELALLQGVMAYKVDFPMKMVYAPLHWAIPHYPEAMRDANFYLAHAFYADALLDRGENVRARQVLEMLLGREEIPLEMKRSIRQRLQNDPALRR